MLDSNSRLLRYHLLRSLIICCFICFSFKTVPVHAQAPIFKWVQAINSSFITDNTSFAVERNGNLHVIGNYYNDLTIGKLTLNSPESSPGFIAKCDANGKAIWLNAIGTGSIGRTVLSNVVVNSAGETLVAGFYNDRCNLGTIMLLNFKNTNAQTPFIAKYDAAGKVLWAKTLSANSAYLTQMTLDSAENIYLTGTILETANFGGIDLVSTNGAGTSFVSKYDRAGNIKWAHLVSGKTCAIAVDSVGNGYLTGGFTGDVATFGNTSLTNYNVFGGHADIFVAKFDSAGNWLWAMQAGEPDDDDYGKALALDKDGNCYVSGYYGISSDPSSHPAVFGSVTLPSAGNKNGFLVKCSPAGSVLWATKLGGEGWNECSGLAVDEVGNVFVGGQSSSTNISIGLITLSNTTIYNNYFAVKFSPNGNALWGKLIPCGWIEGSPFGISVDEGDSVYLFGMVQTPAMFDTIELNTPGPGRVFLARIDAPEISIRTINNQILLAWPTNAVGWHLESASAVNISNWSMVPNLTTVVGSQNTVTMNASGSKQFFRLARP